MIREQDLALSFDESEDYFIGPANPIGVVKVEDEIYNPIGPLPVDPIIPKIAKYRFIDSQSGNVISNVRVILGTGKGLNATRSSSNGSLVFYVDNFGRSLTAAAQGYKPKSFTPQAGKSLDVFLDPIIESKYRFIDSETNLVIPGVELIASKTIDDALIDDKFEFDDGFSRLEGLSAPSESNGVFTFSDLDINRNYTVSADGYSPANLTIVEHEGIKDIKLTKQKATVKFYDSRTKALIKNITVSNVLNGLGATFENNQGIYSFVFDYDQSSANYTVSAPGYKTKSIVIRPTNGSITDIELEPINTVDSIDTEREKRKRLAKAKAAARLRRLILLSI